MAEKKNKKGHDDRRDSPRIPMTFLLRDVADSSAEWVERQGDLSLGGIYWRGKTPPRGVDVDVRFRLPGVPKEIKARGEILRVKDQGGVAIDFHVRFTELDVQSELAIARRLDEWLASDEDD